MRSRLESIKPLDSNVEKDGAKEIKYDKDSYDYLFDEDELFMIEQLRLKDELLSEQGLINENDKKSYYEDNKNSNKGMDAMLAESEMSDEQLTELWSASELGKYTIGESTQAKKKKKKQEQFMKPISELEFQDISDGMDREDAEMQKKLEEAWQELEGIF